ncbi:MAG: polysaccharide lyase family 7 protein, partial [Pseudomonadota bacterium]
MPSVSKKRIIGLTLFGLGVSYYGAVQSADMEVPGDRFDLGQWKLTLPQDENGDNKPDSVTVKELQSYSHPDFFYLNDDGHLVFTAPNKAITTANSTNTRSELREMLRGTNTRYKTHGY